MAGGNASFGVDDRAGVPAGWGVLPGLPPPHGPQGDTLAHVVQLLTGTHGSDDPPAPASALAAHRLAPRRVHAGAALFVEGARAACVYVVRGGSFKLLKTSQEGYEQVLNFVGPGEALGLDGSWHGLHESAAIALEDASVYAIGAAELAEWRRASPAFDRAFARALGRQLVRLSQVAEMMAAVAAEVRLARFLLQLSDRMLEAGQSPRRLYLRMCRRDLASHLGFAHETVSRSFTALAELGLLRVDNRDVEILDAGGLAAFAHTTRGVPPLLKARARARPPAAPPAARRAGRAGVMQA